VILVHGTFANQEVSWNALRPLLQSRGYCVFSLNYGTTHRPDAASGDAVAAFARQVLAQTGAARCPSSGTRRAVAEPLRRQGQGPASQTDDVIGLAPSSHGTTNPLAPPRAPSAAPRAPTSRGSPFMQALNAPPRHPARELHRHLHIHDEVVTPYQSQALTGASVTNVVLQDAARPTSPSTSRSSRPRSRCSGSSTPGPRRTGGPGFRPRC